MDKVISYHDLRAYVPYSSVSAKNAIVLALLSIAEESCVTNHKAFWSYVNSKRKKTEIPIYVSLDGFGASQWERTFLICLIHISNLFTKVELRNAIKDIKKTRPGPDNIPAIYLSQNAQTAYYNLCY